MKKFLVLIIIAVFFWSCNKTETGLDSSLKVMSYNIRYDNRGDSLNNWNDRKFLVTEVIKKEKPDVIGIQEALKHQLDDLNSLLPGYSWIGTGRNDGKNKGEFSPVFYNKQRFGNLENGTFWLSETPDTVSRGWNAACNRICTYIKLKDLKTNKIFVTFNTHFDHEGKTAQIESAKLISRKISNISKGFPFVLTGDFNFTSESEAYRILTDETSVQIKNAKNISNKKHSGISATYNGFNYNFNKSAGAIDHIFVRNKTKVFSHKTIDKIIDNKFPSDHFPVVTEIEFINSSK